MKINPVILDYLHGRRFSNGRTFALDGAWPAMRRSDRLLALAGGKRVLHVGCCDHLPLMQKKILDKTHLHSRLCSVTSACIGMDIQAEGVALLRQLGFPDVYLPQDLPDHKYDICLLADVIEHVGDPVAFLQSMRQYRFDTLIVATPNVFRWRNMLPGGETINTDHRFWFSPFTLCKVMVDAGYEPTGVELCSGDYVSWQGAMAARVFGLAPKYRDTLIVQACTSKG